ncbi:methyl-accepting chemotaxis protein [Lachnospiraceae bacterium KK002]
MEEKKCNETAGAVAVKVRTYSEKPARDAKANHTVLLLMTLMEIPVVLALFIQFGSKEISSGKPAIIPAVILLAGGAVCWGMYLKEKSSEPLRYVILGCFLIGWGYLMVTGKSLMIFSYVIPIMISLILYYDRKFEKRAFAGIMGIMILRGIVLAATGQLLGDDLTLVSVCTGIVITFSYNVTARTAKNFDHDTIWSVKDQQAVQNTMMEDILRISEAVKSEVEQTDGLVENLRDSSQVVHSSIQEISISTQLTAESVQEQTTMTSRIKDAIGETAENARIMVEAAETSARMVEESMELINRMRASAETIGKTNTRVAQSMSQLQDKAREVQQITEVIFEVSSQTNLLALNASIESARAGEAGKGFAVVADQIRELSEQTRKSTEQIAGIIQELNTNAQDAVSIVGVSIEAMSQQNEMIEHAAGGFTAIRDNVETLTRRISDIDSKIENLVQSNDTIIESISQLSATSQQVSASALEAEERSQQNEAEAQEAKKRLNSVQEIVQGFAKYQDS